MRRSLVVLWLAVLGGACAHTPPKPPAEALRLVVERFHERIRWKDYAVAARFLVPERRPDFERARRELHDERDLSITDYEIEEVTFSEDGYRATVVSRLAWMRLPSASEQTARVTSEFVYRDGAWMLERQQQGPFAGELP